MRLLYYIGSFYTCFLVVENFDKPDFSTNVKRHVVEVFGRNSEIQGGCLPATISPNIPRYDSSIEVLAERLVDICRCRYLAIYRRVRALLAALFPASFGRREGHASK